MLPLFFFFDFRFLNFYTKKHKMKNSGEKMQLLSVHDCIHSVGDREGSGPEVRNTIPHRAGTLVQEHRP